MNNINILGIQGLQGIPGSVGVQGPQGVQGVSMHELHHRLMGVNGYVISANSEHILKSNPQGVSLKTLELLYAITSEENKIHYNYTVYNAIHTVYVHRVSGYDYFIFRNDKLIKLIKNDYGAKKLGLYLRQEKINKILNK